MESYSPTSSPRDTRFRDTSHLEFKGSPRGEHKRYGSVVDQPTFGASSYRPPSSTSSIGQHEREEEFFPMKDGQFRVTSRRTRYHLKDRGMFHKLMSGRVLEDRGWLAAATILGLLVSYPLVIKPLHQVSTDMLSKMRGNLKTGAI